MFGMSQILWRITLTMTILRRWWCISLSRYLVFVTQQTTNTNLAIVFIRGLFSQLAFKMQEILSNSAALIETRFPQKLWNSLKRFLPLMLVCFAIHNHFIFVLLLPWYPFWSHASVLQISLDLTVAPIHINALICHYCSTWPMSTIEAI